MGCDIHFYVEKYSNEDYIGPKDILEERNNKISDIIENKNHREYRWIPVDRWVIDNDYDEISWEVPYKESFYQGRNYYLFSILADVRNDGNIDPISQPRGVPEDASYPYKLLLNRWEGDAHSKSYFTLEELLNVKWDEYSKGYSGLDEFMRTIDKMKEIGEDPSNIRCVFFFDN